MDYRKLELLKEKYVKTKELLPEKIAHKHNKEFEIEYTHNSTAIEGNTLSLIETKVIIEDGVSVGNKSMREIYEVANHDKALQYIKACISKNMDSSEKTTKDIHAILMENILIGGVYRNHEVRITGSKHKPPTPNNMYIEIKNFFANLPYKTEFNPIELAAYTHAEFVRIHPFEDGNGRTSRLLMNYQLMINGFFPISINKEERLSYYEALEEYSVNSNLRPFTKMIFDLEEKQLRDYISIVPEKNKEDNLNERQYNMDIER